MKQILGKHLQGEKEEEGARKKKAVCDSISLSRKRHGKEGRAGCCVVVVVVLLFFVCVVVCLCNRKIHCDLIILCNKIVLPCSTATLACPKSDNSPQWKEVTGE